ncbi:XRE family transcriptional regulator [Bosea vestrisii]|uniref:XRE family transcriptional regulator n=1 Tax=Bosea vestrisii TaxID=151416 RepID=A0ABW0H403_9HYPH
MTALQVHQKLGFVEGPAPGDREGNVLRSTIGAGHQQDLVSEGQHDKATVCGNLPSRQGVYFRADKKGKAGYFPRMIASTLGERIQERLVALNKTATGASLEISDNKDLLRDIINGRTKNPRSDTVRKIAAVLECTVEWLMLGDGEPAPPLLEGRPKANARHADVDMPTRGTLIRDIEVRGTIAGSMGGAFQFEGGVVDYVARPPGLINAKGIYACYIEGDSMFPAHPEGELRFISAFKPPRIGDTVAVTARYEPDGPIESFIKTLVKRTATKIYVEQLNPRHTLEFDLKYVISIHKVLTVNELFGI